jgi:D-amino-acid dehydrogenase
VRTIVVGGGVVGVTTAYYLFKEGHEVVVVDKASKVGAEATAVNAGLIAPGHCFAWASPAAPKMLVKSLFGEKTSIRVKPTLNPRFLWWGLQFMRECTSERAAINTLAKMHLCDYSQTKLDEIALAEGIDYQGVDKGLLYLYRDAAELELGMGKMMLLTDTGQ